MRFYRRSFSVLAYLCFTLLLPQAHVPQAHASTSLAEFERKLATFDPAGRHFIKPLERKLPGLALTGSFSHWFDALTSDSDSIGFRDRDYRVLQAQSLLELAASYRFSPNLELTSINHLLYDLAYDINADNALYADASDTRFRRYNETKYIAREFYFAYRTTKFDAVLGKQQVAWGKMDGQFIDVINSMDLRESVQLESSDYENRRLPMWMANITYYFDNFSLNALWIPDFEANLNPTYGAPWSSPLLPPADQIARENSTLLAGRTNAAGDRILATHKPAWNRFRDHQFALRLDVASGALTWGLIYYYAWERDPVPFVTGRFTDASGDHLIVEPSHERLHHFGITSDYAWVASNVPVIGTLPIVFRAEALYTRDAHFVDFLQQGTIRAGASGDAISQHDTIRAALAFEFAFPDKITVIFQPSFYYTFDWREGLGAGFGGAIGDEWNFIPVFFIERPVRRTRDRLKLNATISPYLSGPNKNYQGTKTKLVATYEFSQYIKGSLIYTDYSGGDRDDLFGQYHLWDNIGIEILYEF